MHPCSTLQIPWRPAKHQHSGNKEVFARVLAHDVIHKYPSIHERLGDPSIEAGDGRGSGQAFVLLLYLQVIGALGRSFDTSG